MIVENRNLGFHLEDKEVSDFDKDAKRLQLVLVSCPGDSAAVDCILRGVSLRAPAQHNGTLEDSVIVPFCLQNEPHKASLRSATDRIMF